MKWVFAAAGISYSYAAWVDVPPPYSGTLYERSGLTYEAFGAVDGNGDLLDTMGLTFGASPFLPDASTTGTCADACQNGVPFPDSSEAYIRCISFIDTFVPNERQLLGLQPNGTDFTGYEFRLDTNTNTPQGCTFDAVNKVLYYNQNAGTGECSDQRQCICQCSYATASPTSSPVANVESHPDIDAGTGGNSIPCSVMPNDAFGNANGVPVDLALYDYVAPTVDENNVITSGADFTVRPWMNWLDSDLFNQDPAFPFNAEKANDQVVVSGWLDFVAPTQAFSGGESTPDYPYQRLKDGEDTSCRIIMNEDGRFDNSVILHSDGCTFATADNRTDHLHRHTDEVVWTNYSFYVASTLCYTVQPVEQCQDVKTYSHDGARTWQSDAYTMPTEWKAAYTQFVPEFTVADDGAAYDSAAHVAQCRREWQAVRLRVKYGGEVSILPTVTLDVTQVVQQPDGAIVVPESEEQWQKYDDFAAQQLDFSHFRHGTNTGRYKFQTPPNCVGSACTGGVVEATKDTTTAGDGQQLIEFTKFYQWKFEIDDTIFFGDKNLQQLVLEQYDTLDASFTWQRCLEEHAPCTLDAHWQNLDDYYLVDATETGVNGAVRYLNNHVGGNTIDYATQQSESIVDFSINSGLRIINNAHIEDDIRLHLEMTWTDLDIPTLLNSRMVLLDDGATDAGGYVVGGVEAASCADASVGGVACTPLTEAECEAYAASYSLVYLGVATNDLGDKPQGCFHDTTGSSHKLEYGPETAGSTFSTTYEGVCKCPNPVEHKMEAVQVYDSTFVTNNEAAACGLMNVDGRGCRNDVTHTECLAYATALSKVLQIVADTTQPRCFEDASGNINYNNRGNDPSQCTATEKCLCNCPVENPSGPSRRLLRAVENVHPRRALSVSHNSSDINIEIRIEMAATQSDLEAGHTHGAHSHGHDDEDAEDEWTTAQVVGVIGGVTLLFVFVMWVARVGY